MIEFDWDEGKRLRTLDERGIDFADLFRVFFAPTVRFPSNRSEEVRWMLIGLLYGEEVVVIYTMRGGVYRIISARRAHENEREVYRQALSDR